MPAGSLQGLDELLAPIDGGAGPDVRTDPAHTRTFQALRAARSSARSAERRIATGDESDSGPRPNWRQVLDLAAEVIARRSKDLEAVAYLIEAMVRLHGFAGLRDGFRLCRGLVGMYWDDLHPRPDEEGLATRVAPLMGLNGEGMDGTLIVPILNVPLTAAGGDGPFACSHYERALSLEQVTDPNARKRRIENGVTSLETLRKAAAETPLPMLVQTASEIDESLREFAALTSALDELCGELSPHSSNIRNALTSCRAAVQGLAGDRLRLSEAWASQSVAEGLSVAALSAGLNGRRHGHAIVEEDNDAGEAGMPEGYDPSAEAIPSREHALLMLQEIAGYFRRTEPHSPLAYTLEQAIRWGRTPLPELLVELIPDLSVRSQYFRLVGIVPPP
jgi:type VI secretion system protein ImpA